MEATSKSLDLRNVFPIQNEQSLINHFNDRKYLAGIYFHNISHVEEAHTVPEKLSVTLSFPSEFRTSKHPDIYNRLWLTRCSGVLNDFDTDRLQHADLYLREGFLQIQHRLFVEWLKMLQSGSLDHAEIDYSLPTISVRSLRHHTDHEPCHTECSSNLIWFLYYFTFFLPFLRVIKVHIKDIMQRIFH